MSKKFTLFLFSIISMFIFLLLLAACTPASPLTPTPTNAPLLLTDTPTPTPSATLPATLTPTLVPATATLIPATATPSKTSIPLHTMEPLVTPPSPGISLEFDSWSKDSAWIAYWLVEYQEETSPASLAFVHVDSGEICLHPEVITESYGYGLVRWQDDGRALVAPNPGGDTFTGVPCETFTPSGPLPEPTGEISPDGRYRVDNTYEAFEEGPNSHVVTTLTDLTTDQIINSVSWDFAPYDAQGGGPQWLNNEVYLIGPAYDQGFLYFSVPDGKVENVQTDLLGLEETYTVNYRTIFSQVDLVEGSYHLLLRSEQGPTLSPLLLYHSETEEIETLPFNMAFPFSFRGRPFQHPGFSPDGQWLLMGGMEGGDYWLRPVDPPGSEAIQLAGVGSPGGLSLEAQKMAFFREDTGVVNLLSFPTGIMLGQWSAPEYDLLAPVEWSPDGSCLAVMGYQYALNQTTLFLIEP